MSQEQIHQFKIALGIAGIAVDMELAELIMGIHNAVKEKGENCNIRDIMDVEERVKFNNVPGNKYKA